MSLKALTESDRNVLYKNLRPCFFLTVVTTCIAYECTANIFSKAHVELLRKVGKQSHKLTYYFLPHLMDIYNSSEMESNFSVQFWDCVSGGWHFYDMVSVCLWRIHVCSFLLTCMLVKTMSKSFPRLFAKSFDDVGKDYCFLGFHNDSKNIPMNTTKLNCFFVVWKLFHISVILKDIFMYWTHFRKVA